MGGNGLGRKYSTIHSEAEFLAELQSNQSISQSGSDSTVDPFQPSQQASQERRGDEVEGRH